MKTKILIASLSFGLLLSCQSPQKGSDKQMAGKYKMDRTVLPIHPPQAETITEMDARNVEKPDIFEVKAPEGAPNIVLVMIDDIGFGATNTLEVPLKLPLLVVWLIMD